MNKKELTQAVYDELEDITKKDTKAVIDQVWSKILNSVKQDEDVTIKKIGTFTSEKVGSHTVTKESGEKIRVSSREEPILEPSSQAIDAIDGGDDE